MCKTCNHYYGSVLPCRKCHDYYNGRWYIAYYPNREHGQVEKYKPSNHEGGKLTLVEGVFLYMHKGGSKDMLEFDEYRGKVYTRVG